MYEEKNNFGASTRYTIDRTSQGRSEALWPHARHRGPGTGYVDTWIRGTSTKSYRGRWRKHSIDRTKTNKVFTLPQV